MLKARLFKQLLKYKAGESRKYTHGVGVGKIILWEGAR